VASAAGAAAAGAATLVSFAIVLPSVAAATAADAAWVADAGVTGVLATRSYVLVWKR
jgi:hypothetical protein